MKKFFAAACALLCAIPAFAYDDFDFYSRRNEMSGFAVFTLIVIIAYIVLSIVVLVRWWRMTKDVKQIKEQTTYNKCTPEYLILIGEKDKAQKIVLTDLVDRLIEVYEYNFMSSPLYYNKAEEMNKVIQDKQPEIDRMGLTMPDYVTSGEKFIDYVNALTGMEVKYKYE